MDVDVTAEAVVPTSKFITLVHPNMPTSDHVAQIDGSIEYRKSVDITHEPTDLSTKSPVEFIVHGTPNHLIDLSSFVLDVELKITNSDGTITHRNEWKTHFINNLTQSLWSVVKVYLNDVCVESNYNNPQISNLKFILTTPNTLVEERGEVQGCFPVTSETLTHAAIANAHLEDNTIMNDRIAFSTKDIVHVRGPLQLDLSTCEKYLVDGVTFKLVLEPAPVAYLIKTMPPQRGAQTYDYKLLSVKLSCAKIKATDGAALAIRRQIAKTPFEYLMRRTILHREIIPAGFSEYVATRPFQNLIPNKIYIFLVDRDGATGNQLRYPFAYHHHGLSHYSVKINGFQVAGGSVTNADYRKEYMDSLLAHSNDYFIPFKNYTSGNFVLCVNCNDQSELNNINIDKTGNLSVSLSFAPALDRPLVLHIAGSIDSPFTIDLDRTITTEFQY